MSYPLQSAISKNSSFLVSLGVSCVLTGLLHISGIIPFWDTGIYDLCMNIRVFHSPAEQNPIIANIVLDDASEEILGAQIDTRQAFADALEVLGKINTAVTLDFLFRYEKENDVAFVDAVKNSVNPVIAVLAVDKNAASFSYRELTDSEKQMMKNHVWNLNVKNAGNIPEARTFLLPFEAIGMAAAQLAHINMGPDADGIYRRVPLLYRWEGGFIPSLPLAAAVLELGFPIEAIELNAGHYLTLSYSENEKISIPIDKKGNMLIPYTNTWAESESISLYTIVEAKKDPAVFNTVFSGLTGCIALVAEISTSQKDFGPTSFEHLFPLSGIHASVLSGILDGFEQRSFIGIPSVSYKILAILFLLTVAFLLIKTQKDIQFHLGFLFMMLMFTGFTFFRWINSAIAPWFAIPAILFFFLWFSAYLLRLVSSYREQELLKNALSRYFPRALAERIMREKRTELVPAYKELTILFSDISGFTKWSSTKSPGQVHDFLSDYLESMAAILFSHGGTVDKFMGDGILAFFGDPFDMLDHCERCIKAAIAMQKKIIILAEKWKQIVDIDLKVRVGINTGKVIVGNLGSNTRIEYTVIGAAVNLAQRMESNAPLGGILVTSDVWEKVNKRFAFTEKKQVKAKGYDEIIEAYEVRGGMEVL